MNHKHAYQRLSDDAVFCGDCGDIKRSEPPVCTLPHYPVYPYVPYVPWWQPVPAQPWRWEVTSGTVTTGSIVVGSTALYPGDAAVTYTVES